MKELAKKYNVKECEKKWQEYWQKNNIFKFDWNDVKDRNKIYAIDTPPPHISGQLHMGHIFGFAQMDIIARYQRMQGKNVFYPIGYDDNGLPSERYVEKKINKKSKSMERHEFVEICDKEIKDAELLIKNSLIKAGYSFDFDAEYRTISPMSRKISQMSFLDLYEKNYLYRKEEPVIWDVVDQTALAQTEAEDAEVESKMNYIKFKVKKSNTDLVIMTTRPELLPACVALFVHPDDKAKYEGMSAITPLGIEVPILFDESVEKDKGTGIMMCCTFGDSADVEKYKKYKLPLKMIINEKGCLYFYNVPEIAEKYKSRLDGLFTTKAREEILSILAEEGKIAKDPEKITHIVKVGERSKSPLEIIVKKQWNIKVLDIKEELHKKASEIKWYPEWMEGRIHSWIDGLSWDWTISRQRFFGVPVPCWYSKRVGEEGKVILPTKDQLPVDPTKDLPVGYTKEEVVGETDVFDTWMTSSVSPQLSAQGINENFIGDETKFKALSLPFDLRPQGHDIIRTWAFCTLVKANYHQNIIPWKNIFVNGFCLASDGTKMSKSKGNGVDPMKTIDEFGTDAVRYWTANSQLGTDTNYSTDMIKIGQKLITKLYNSGKFVEMCLNSLQDNEKIEKSKLEIRNYLIDEFLLSKLHTVVETYKNALNNYEYNKALEVVENFFWNDFCDNYLEIVKIRCYGVNAIKYQDKNLTEEEKTIITQGQISACLTIKEVFKALLKLFSPYLPHITDELYSCLYEEEFNITKSISSRGNCVDINNFKKNEEVEKIGEISKLILAEVRKYKSEKNISIKEVIDKINVYCCFDLIDVIEDLKNVCNVNNIKVIEDKEFKVEF